jgi:hypothetical protein
VPGRPAQSEASASPTETPQLSDTAADPHRNPTDETAHSGTLVMRVKDTENSRSAASMRVSWAVGGFPGKCSRGDRPPEKRKLRGSPFSQSAPLLDRPASGLTSYKSGKPGSWQAASPGNPRSPQESHKAMPPTCYRQRPLWDSTGLRVMRSVENEPPDSRRSAMMTAWLSCPHRTPINHQDQFG